MIVKDGIYFLIRKIVIRFRYEFHEATTINGYLGEEIENYKYINLEADYDI